MNRRWQANKIGLINFWYYDEQEFPFVKGRMLLRGSNGSGKSVTMQSVVPLLLDGNMSPERLDPFGSRDRKMSSYLLEENDGREERTGYLYLEFRRKDSETYLTIGMGIRARRGKPLDKWYFSLTDGRRIGKDFFLYKEMGEKVTLSKKELENRILQGGKVFDRQADYMEYVNKQIFGFETVDEYKEMVDLLIQLRTPKLSKDFKPSVINDILSDSLQPLSDEDLRPMSEAIENMDTMSMNLKSRKEAKAAAEKINAVFSKYNKIILCDKAARYEQTRIKLQEIVSLQKKYERNHEECVQKIEQLTCKIEQINAKREAMEKEKESLNKSDAVALKMRDSVLSKELEEQRRNKDDKEKFLASKQEQYVDAKTQIKDEEDRKFDKETEINSLLEDMQEEAELYHTELVEKICELDDDLMMEYLEGEEPSNDKLKAVLRKATCECTAVPVCCGSAYRNKGVQKLLDAIVEYMPAPTDIPPIQGVDEDGNEVDPSETTSSDDGVKYDEYGNVIDSDNTVDPDSVSSSSSSSSSSGSGSSIVDYATQFVGNPYVWGGTSLTGGADCSGFTQSVYAQFGYSLPRTSYEQQNWGTEVSYADAQPGDLICYGGHVAIYMGNGQIVHASNSRDGIKISNDATYRTILSVRRPS